MKQSLRLLFTFYIIFFSTTKTYCLIQPIEEAARGSCDASNEEVEEDSSNKITFQSQNRITKTSINLLKEEEDSSRKVKRLLKIASQPQILIPETNGEEERFKVFANFVNLLEAIKTNDTTRLVNLIDNYPYLKKINKPIPPIIWAIGDPDREPNFTIVTILINKEFSINHSNSEFEPTLTYILVKLIKCQTEETRKNLLDILNFLLENGVLIPASIMRKIPEGIIKNTISPYYEWQQRTYNIQT